jgi:hypothetical protein
LSLKLKKASGKALQRAFFIALNALSHSSGIEFLLIANRFAKARQGFLLIKAFLKPIVLSFYKGYNSLT